jgi:hypothetical protein
MRNLMKVPNQSFAPQSTHPSSASPTQLPSSQLHPVSNQVTNHKWFVVPMNRVNLRRKTQADDDEGTRIRRTPLEEVNVGPWMMQLRQQQNQHQNYNTLVASRQLTNHQQNQQSRHETETHQTRRPNEVFSFPFHSSSRGTNVEELPQNDESYFPLQPDLEHVHQQQFQQQKHQQQQESHSRNSNQEGRFLDDIDDYEYRILAPLYPSQFLFDLQGMDDNQLLDLADQLDHDPKSVQDSLLEATSERTAMTSGETKGGPNPTNSRQQLVQFQKMLQEHSSKTENNKDKGDSVLKLSEKIKRGEGPQLSVVSPLDVLRQQLIYELARRRIKENREKIQVNEQLLKTIGKRSVDPKFDPRRHQTFMSNPDDVVVASFSRQQLSDSSSVRSIRRR